MEEKEKKINEVMDISERMSEDELDSFLRFLCALNEEK